MSDMIEEPAFIQIYTTTCTISGNFSSYSDPENAPAGFMREGSFVGKGTDGTIHYILWGTIIRLSVFPLGITPPATPLVVEENQSAR